MNRQKQSRQHYLKKRNGFLHPDSLVFPAALAFCGCFLDVVTVMGLFNTFTGAITGSVIFLFIDLVNSPSTAPSKGIVIIAFVVSTTIWHSRIAHLKSRGKRLLKNTLYTEVIVLVVFFLITANFNLSSPLSPATIVCICVSAAAMSLQHLITSGILSHALPTTAITGTTVRFLGSSHKILLSSIGAPEVDNLKERNSLYLITIIFFFLGGLAGAICWKYFNFNSLMIPIFIILMLALAAKEG